MIEFPHQFDLIFEGFATLIAGVLSLFGEGFDGNHFVIPQPLGEIDRGEGSLPYFLFGLEQ